MYFGERKYFHHSDSVDFISRNNNLCTSSLSLPVDVMTLTWVKHLHLVWEEKILCSHFCKVDFNKTCDIQYCDKSSKKNNCFVTGAFKTRKLFYIL